MLLNTNQILHLNKLNVSLEEYFLILYTRMGRFTEASLLTMNSRLVYNGKPTKFGWKVLKEVENIAEGETFKKLYELYPKDDAVNGFQATRTNVVGSRATALEAYNDLILQGYSEKEILEGTIAELDRLRAESVLDNKFTYITGLARFLAEKKFANKPYTSNNNETEYYL